MRLPCRGLAALLLPGAPGLAAAACRPLAGPEAVRQGAGPGGPGRLRPKRGDAREDDVFVMVQTATVGPVSAKLVIDKRWPSLGGVWDRIKQTVSNLTSEVGDITQDLADDLVQDLNPITGQATDVIATELADALNAALDTVFQEVDTLMNKTLANRETFTTKYLNATVTEQLLIDLDKGLDSLVDNTAALWQLAYDAMAEVVDVLTGSLKAAGQSRLGDVLAKSMHRATSKVDTFLYRLASLRTDLSSLRDKKLAQLRLSLLDAHDMLTEATQQIGAFAEKLPEAFDELIDLLSNALPWGEKVNSAFSPVQHRVTSITWRARGACREFTTTVHKGIALYARNASIQLPAWQPAASASLQTGVQHSDKSAAQGQVFSRGLFIFVPALLQVVALTQ